VAEMLAIMRRWAAVLLALKVREAAVVANGLYIVTILGFAYALTDYDWLARPFLVSWEVLLLVSSIGTITTLVATRLIPLPFRKPVIKHLWVLFMLIVIAANAFWSYSSIESFYALFTGEFGIDPNEDGDSDQLRAFLRGLEEVALFLGYVFIASLNIAVLVMLKIKKRLGEHSRSSGAMKSSVS